MVMNLLLNYSRIFYKSANVKPTLYFLIGPPAVGKSTWVKKYLPNVKIINMDDIVEEVAKEKGIGTYDDMFNKPPSDLIPPDILPNKDTYLKAESGDVESKDKINTALKIISQVAYNWNNNPSNYDTIKHFGILIPFDEESLKTVITVYSVPPEYLVPFKYSNIQEAEGLVTERLNNTRKDAVLNNSDLAIDMTNMSRSERDGHRTFLTSILDGNLEDNYNQVAIVFGSEAGYSEEDIVKIKQVANKRAEEIRSAGRSKTIPDKVFDMMFKRFEHPIPEEGFSKIIYVGIPSIGIST